MTALALLAELATAVTGPAEDSVTPGLLGFLVVFCLALATWLLMRNLTARLRRLKFREEQRQAEASATPAGDQPDLGEPADKL
jgi:hypothetical protein